MITYCGNAVKLIQLKSENKVQLIILHTEQLLIVDIRELEVCSDQYTVIFHGKDLELELELNRLNHQSQAYSEWKKRNG